MNFSPSYGDHDVWMWSLLIPSACTTTLSCILMTFLCPWINQRCSSRTYNPPWNYKLKGVGEPCCHCGADFFCDDDRTLCMGMQTYSICLLDNKRNSLGAYNAQFTLPWLRMISQSLTPPLFVPQMTLHGANDLLGASSG